MKKSVVIVSFLVLFLTIGAIAQPKVVVTDMPRSVNDGLNNLADQIAQGLTENQKRRIAVVEFVDLKGNVSDFGRFISEKLITRLFQSKKFTVIERQQLNKIIAEQKLGLTGIIDPSSAQKLGKLLGVDSVATGSVSDLGKIVAVNARLISTETGEVFSAASVDITKDEAVCNLMGSCTSSVRSNSEPETKPTATNRVVNPTPTPTPAAIKRIVDSNFLTFEISKCTQFGASVKCELFVTNNTQDREIGFFNSSWEGSIIDDSGNKASGSDVEVANLRRNSIGGGATVYVYLVNGIRTKGALFYEGASPDAKKIVRLFFRVCTGGGNCFYVQFNDIPLTGK